METILRQNGLKRILFTVFCLLFLHIHVYSQFHLNATVQNMHLWRGMEAADGLVFTGKLSMTDKNNNFQGGLWAGTNTVATYKEFNYFITYKYKRLCLELWDIYNYSPNVNHNNKEFFNYKAKETGRFIDATISYEVSDKIPLLISWSTILFGRDRDEMNEGNRYSTFLFGEYPVFKNGLWEVHLGVGGAFAIKQRNDEFGNLSRSNFYGKTAGIVHVGLKTIYHMNFFKHDFPITINALWNPQSNKGYMQLSLCLLSI